MVARTDFHFDDHIYRHLLDDRLAPDKASDVSTHIENCSDCQSRLESIAQEQISWDDVQRYLGSEAPAEFPLEVTRPLCNGVSPAAVEPQNLLVDGQSLQQRVTKNGSLSVQEVLRIGMQVAAGLAAAHHQGLVHRDVKPGNILLENGVERVLITDFGLARAIDDASVTHSGVIAGTPQYMSPEQAKGESMDHRADLFSFGSVLYFMCTGRSPFRAESTMGVLRRICDESPRPMREINAEIPEWLDALVVRLLANWARLPFDLKSKTPRWRFDLAAMKSASTTTAEGSESGRAK